MLQSVMHRDGDRLVFTRLYCLRGFYMFGNVLIASSVCRVFLLVIRVEFIFWTQ